MALIEQELAGRRFTFYAVKESWTKTFTFLADGEIQGSDHPNETYWRVREGKLELVHSDRTTVTSIYDIVKSRDGKYYFEGCFQADKNYILALKEPGY